MYRELISNQDDSITPLAGDLEWSCTLAFTPKRTITCSALAANGCIFRCLFRFFISFTEPSVWSTQIIRRRESPSTPITAV